MRNVKKQMDDKKVIFPVIQIVKDPKILKDKKSLKRVGDTIKMTNWRIGNYKDRIDYMYEQQSEVL